MVVTFGIGELWIIHIHLYPSVAPCLLDFVACISNIIYIIIYYIDILIVIAQIYLYVYPLNIA